MNSVCAFCGMDPYEYVDVGVGWVPVAVTCCYMAYSAMGGPPQKRAIDPIMGRVLSGLYSTDRRVFRRCRRLAEKMTGERIHGHKFRWWEDR